MTKMNSITYYLKPKVTLLFCLEQLYIQNLDRYFLRGRGDYVCIFNFAAKSKFLF